MRALSQAQANRCENATHPQCRCRCGGALHGAARGNTTDNPRFFEKLSPNDPHKRPDEEEQRAARNWRARRRADITRSKRRVARGEQPLDNEMLFGPFE